MKEDLKQKIIDDIYKTGFVAELKVSSLLVKDDWRVENNKSYQDKDQDKNREIDVVAYKGKYQEDVKLRVGMHLICEVKKTNKPWIIFSTEPSSFFDKENFPGWSMVNCHNNLTNQQLKYNDFKSNYMRLGYKRIGSAFHEAFKNPNEPSKIFEAILSACKAAEWQKQVNSEPKIDKYDRDKEHSIDIFLPIIILEGDLIEAYLDRNGNMELEAKEYIPINYAYSSPKYDADSFYPDIITINGLENYINMVNLWYKTVSSKIIENINKELIDSESLI